MRKAALSARDLIDFGRAGTVGKGINKVSAFWNANVQGLDKTVRTFKKHPYRTLIKSMALITAPTAGLYEINKNDPRYQELQQWDKDLFWHFWIGDVHFRLPIPFELGVAFKVVPERLLSMTEGEKRPFREFGDTAKTISPIPNPLHPLEVLSFVSAFTPLAEVMANKNFAGAPIVPTRELHDAPEDQFGPYTSSAAKGISKLAGNVGLGDTYIGSPRKLEHVIQGYTGSLGRYLLQGIDKAADVSGLTNRPPRPATGLEDMPGFKAFIGKSIPTNTDSLDRFYERFGELSKAKRHASQNDLLFKDAAEEKLYSKINGRIGKLRGDTRTILNDPNMSPQEKRDQLDRIFAEMNDLAKQALSNSKG